MIRYGIANELINKSVIKPIPKNMQKSLSVSSNYRAISKNSIISKIIDNIILLQIKDKLITSSYQFAYKEGYSTSLCSFLVAETIQYYKANGSDVLRVVYMNISLTIYSGNHKSLNKISTSLLIILRF